MDRGAWRATVHGVAKTQIRLGDGPQDTFIDAEDLGTDL